MRDAGLAYELFLDQGEALQQRVEEHPDEALCLHYLLAQETVKGIADFFLTLRRAHYDHACRRLSLLGCVLQKARSALLP